MLRTNSMPAMGFFRGRRSPLPWPLPHSHTAAVVRAGNCRCASASCGPQPAAPSCTRQSGPTPASSFGGRTSSWACTPWRRWVHSRLYLAQTGCLLRGTQCKTTIRLSLADSTEPTSPAAVKALPTVPRAVAASLCPADAGGGQPAAPHASTRTGHAWPGDARGEHGTAAAAAA